MTSEKASPIGNSAAPSPKAMCDRSETTTQTSRTKKVATVRGRIAMFEVIANTDCEPSQSGQKRAQKELASFKLDSIRDYFRCGGSLPPHMPVPDDAKRRSSEQPNRSHSLPVKARDREGQPTKLTTFGNASWTDESTTCFESTEVEVRDEIPSKRNEGGADEGSGVEETLAPNSLQSQDTEKELQTPATDDFPASPDIEIPVTCLWIPETHGGRHFGDIASTKKDVAEEDNEPEAAQENEYQQAAIPDISTMPSTGVLTTSEDRDSAYLSLSYRPSSTDGTGYDVIPLDEDTGMLDSRTRENERARRPSSDDYEKANPSHSESVYERICDDLGEPSLPSSFHSSRKHAAYIPRKAVRSCSWRLGSAASARSDQCRSRGISNVCEVRRRALSVDHLGIWLGSEEAAFQTPVTTPNRSAQERTEDSNDSCSDVGFESSSEFDLIIPDFSRASDSSLVYDGDVDEADPYDHPRYLMMEDPYDTPSALELEMRGRSDTSTTITQPRDKCQHSDYLYGACFEDHGDVCLSGIPIQSTTRVEESEYDNFLGKEYDPHDSFHSDISDVFEEIPEDEDIVDESLVLQRSLSPLFYFGSTSPDPPTLPDRPRTENESKFSPKSSTSMSPSQSPPSRKDAERPESNVKVDSSVVLESQEEGRRSQGSSSEGDSSAPTGHRQRKLSDNSWDRVMRARTMTVGRQLSIPVASESGIQGLSQLQLHKKRPKLKNLISVKFAFKRSRSYQNLQSAEEMNTRLVVSDIPNDTSMSFDDSSQSSTPPSKTKKRGRRKTLMQIFTGEKGGKKEEKSTF